jgi:hypothetical protein
VTARTAAITSLTQLAGMIREISDAAEAAGRTGGIDVVCPYRDWSVESPALKADRHREAFAGYEKAGVTGLVVTSATRAAPATLEFIQAFGQAYLR